MEERDETLWTRWRQTRDADAFAQIVSRHAGMMFATCRRILGDAMEAEDVVQDCFLKLAIAEGAVSRFSAAWLHRLATSRSLDRLRQAKRRATREDRYARSRPEASELKWGDIEHCVDEAIAELPETVRNLVVRHFLEGESYSDLAESLQIPRATLARRVQAGVASLREALEKRGLSMNAAVLGLMLNENPLGGLSAGLSSSLAKMGLAGGARPALTWLQVLGGTLMANKVVVSAGVAALGLAALVAFGPFTRSAPTAPSLGADAAVAKTEPDRKQTVSRASVSVDQGNGKKKEAKADPLLALLRIAMKRHAGKAADELKPFGSLDVPAENGAHYFLLATELLPDVDEDLLEELLEAVRTKGWQNDPRAQALLEQCRASLDAIRQGVELGNATLPPMRGPDEPLPYLRKFRTLGKLMDLEAQMQAGNGDYGAAVDTYTTMLNFAGQSSRGGGVIGQLVGNTIEGVGLSDIGAVLQASDLPPESLLQLASTAQSIQTQRPGLSEAVANEADSFTEWFHNSFPTPESFQTYVQSDGFPFGDDELRRTLLNTVTGLSARDLYTSMETALSDYRSAAALLDRPYNESQQSASNVTDTTNAFGRALIPDISNLSAAAARADAQLDGLVIASSLEAFKRRTGEYPSTLSALCPDYLAKVPTDPFTGQSLAYSRNDTGYLLYSAGVDMNYDGGINTNWKDQGGDLMLSPHGN